MQKQQEESSPFTTAGKSFEKNYTLYGYYICVHHEGTICKNLLIILKLVRLFTNKSSLLTEYCYIHFNNYFVEHIRGDMRGGVIT